jgi:hypothetical protein
MVAMFARRLCNSDGRAEMSKVCIVHEGVSCSYVQLRLELEEGEHGIESADLKDIADRIDAINECQG